MVYLCICNRILFSHEKEGNPVIITTWNDLEGNRLILWIYITSSETFFITSLLLLLKKNCHILIGLKQHKLILNLWRSKVQYVSY